ncbi:FG-GAP repeat domain-containing protein [Desulfovibrio inopinatus]|uniref:FG-GAP repeat domain-containing protein n=1 Tax=Desulfovibrio inopinatus TaxID=102109 RepID=UPI00041709EC|nr:VCBS repeat-containing protein [Desulfovibrio inopinatus]
MNIRKMSITGLLCLATVLSAICALAADVKTFTVEPFAVHGPEKYQYLSQGIKSMLNSRLTWTNHFQPVADNAKADYKVSGSVTISGNIASVDATVSGPDGQSWPQSTKAKLDGLIPAMEGVADNINAKIFKRPAKPGSANAASAKTGQAPMNPNFVVNATEGELGANPYLNPRFRYVQGPDTPGRWRSQSLRFPSFGVAVGDITGDGNNETILMGQDGIHAFTYSDRQLKPLADYETSPNLMLLHVDLFDLNKDGRSEIIVAGYINKEAASLILSYENGKLVVKADRIKYFLTVAPVPPEFSRSLVGGKSHPRDLFQEGIYEMIYSGGTVQASSKVNLPRKANPFNFAFYPEESGYKVILVNNNDRLVVYTSSGELMAETEEKYAGSAIGLQFDDLMAPMDKPDADYLWTYYYVPLPLLVANLDKDNRYELLVNKNISVAAQFFENFRSFAQGEIHAMYWDGVGLNLMWKTRRIKGTVTGYTLADIDNDGEKQLVVAVNTYPGPSGFGKSRTVIYAYDLNTDSDPNATGYSNVEPAQE